MEPARLNKLVADAKAGRAEAFDALVDAFGPRLYGYLYRLVGSREDSEDLLQEVYVRIVRTIGDYDHDGRFEAWIFRIATNLVRDRVRGRRREPAVVSLDCCGNDRTSQPFLGLTDATAQPPDATLEKQEEVDRLQEALGRLSAVEREAIVLRHFARLSFDELAKAMGTPLGTALARVHRGLARLRAIMGGQA